MDISFKLHLLFNYRKVFFYPKDKYWHIKIPIHYITSNCTNSVTFNKMIKAERSTCEVPSPLLYINIVSDDWTVPTDSKKIPYDMTITVSDFPNPLIEAQQLHPFFKKGNIYVPIGDLMPYFDSLTGQTRDYLKGVIK